MLIPQALVDAELKSGQLIALLPDWQAYDHAPYAVYPYHRGSSPKVRALIDFLSDYFSPD